MSQNDRDHIDPRTRTHADQLDHIDPRTPTHADQLDHIDPRTRTHADHIGHIYPRTRTHADELHRVRTLEVQLLDPAVRADPERLAELLHPDFAEHGASGRVWTRQQIIDELPLEDDTTPPTTASDLVGQHLTDDIILVTYRTASTLKNAIRSSLWLKAVSGAWQIRFHQGTPIPSGGPH